MHTVTVTGVGVVCAIAGDAGAFERALREGRRGVRPCPDGGPPAALLDEEVREALPVLPAGAPDALRRAAERLTRRAPLPLRAAVGVAAEAWIGAGLHIAAVPGDRVGLVVAGSNLTGRHLTDLHDRYANRPAHLPPRAALRLLDTDHVGTISQLLQIRGEGCTVGAASASGNAGLVHGARLVATGEADVCLVVGALADLSAIEERALLNVGAMAPGPVGPPFDETHGGFAYGQGAACVVLESRRSARARGAEVLAELAGWDLRLAANSLTEPDGEAEAATMTRAMSRAGVSPGDVSYVNAHGTGAPLGDAAEAEALRWVLGEAVGGAWVNSTKALTGHCLAAAGVVEAVATVVQMRGGFVHPNPGLAHPADPGLRFAPATGGVRADIGVALSNGFGFGGFNGSVVFRAPA
ncbi:beta-ketoacyl synthase N-terminal-like domain-containing protein [Microbispora hainanensis]|uniref:Ketosynthase family 3 (KS3) domain-containing protein n=1 Tax=Microbispora hainanensis TaxID=568844 RepID=A0ABZ1SZA8_9ACTN|nr:beta-ketoacyl synthase N-terminal-like domain-containing protein [Microbispora hainanensis]